MPEGPEVETVRRTLEPRLLGRTLGAPWVSGLALRQRVPSRRQLGAALSRPVDAVMRRGKVLAVQAGNGGAVIRLGMTGRIEVVDARSPRAPHTHVVWRVDNNEIEVRYVDARRFGDVRPYADAAEADALLSSIGVEPAALSKKGVRDAVIARAMVSTSSLKMLLLDQSRIAGLGNIYVCEVLFCAGLSPELRGCDVTEDQWHSVLKISRTIFLDAVKHRGTSFSDYVDAEGRKGRYQHKLRVFQREGAPCPTCTAPIARMAQQGRSTFFCPVCQQPGRRQAGPSKRGRRGRR